MGKDVILADHSHCTGCNACADSCPTNSITFVRKGLHDYPQINHDSCVGCGRCMSVCPILKPTNLDIQEQQFYCGWSKDADEIAHATSGGIGSALSRNAIDRGFIVCGAEFDNRWHLKHTLASDFLGIQKFRGSKYLKSDTFGVGRDIVRIIKEGGKVLFIGTPCQCDAITHLVPVSSRDNLISVAIICHGVNSPIVWNDYVNYIEKKCNAKLVDYNFRSKAKGWGQNKRGNNKLRVYRKMSNGKTSDVSAWRNLFHVWFGRHYMLRESCFRCQYRQEHRLADITIGDFWGIKDVLPDLDTDKGASVVITSSKRGEDFLLNCKGIELIVVDSFKTIKVLKGFVNKRSEDIICKEVDFNQRFEQEYELYGFEMMAKRYPAPTMLSMAVAFIKSHLGIK